MEMLESSPCVQNVSDTEEVTLNDNLQETDNTKENECNVLGRAKDSSTDFTNFEENQNLIHENENLVNCDIGEESVNNHVKPVNETNSPVNEFLGIQQISKSRIVKHKKPRKRITVAYSDSESDESNNTLQTILEGNPKSPGKSFEENNDENKSVDMKASKGKTRKRITMLQSDSEDEPTSPSSPLSETISSNQRNGSNMFESDSEDGILKTNSESKSPGGKVTRKKFALEDSDSEMETITPHNKSFSDDIQQQETPVYTTNSKGELIAEESTPKPSKWSALCDSESSADEKNRSDEEKSDNGSDNDSMSEEVVKPLRYKKKSKSKGEIEPRKMTGKEAEQLRTEIRSESQRMTRESNISLPYHRPKAFTLKEFLSRRPKLTSAIQLAAKTPPSVAIKMSVEQLEVISKKLEERHKEVKEFYKSDSEEDLDDNDDSDYVPPDPEKNSEVSNKEESETTLVEKYSKVLDNTENIKLTENLENVIETVNENENRTKTMDEANEKNLNSDIKDVDESMETTNDHNLDSGINTQDDFECGSTDCNLNKADDFGEEDKTPETNDDEISTLNNEISEATKSSNLNKDISCLDDSEVDSPDLSNCEGATIQNDNVGNIDRQLEEDIVKDKLEGTVHQRNSMEYEFNLDDMEDNTEKITNVEVTNREEQRNDDPPENQYTDLLQDFENEEEPFDFSELDKEIENFGKNTTPAQAEKPRFSKLEVLKERLSNIQPRLSSSPNNVIDLETVAKPTQITKLMERFAKHTAKKQLHKDKVKLNIVSVESGGEIHKETVALNVEDEEDTGIEEKPGVRMQRLRNDLQSQIAQQKFQLWQSKVTKEVKSTDEDPYQGEKSECGVDDAILDNDDEEEMTESSDDDFDDEEEMEDETEVEPKKKSAFVDDEAEESDVEGEAEENNFKPNREEQVVDDDVSEIEEDDEIESKVSDNENEDEASDDDNKENEHDGSNTEENTPFKKPLRRIIKGFTEDSDDDDDVEVTSTVNKIAEKLSRNNNEEFNPITQDDYIPPYQLQNQNTPIRDSYRERSNSDLKFLTPISYLTGLHNLTTSTSKIRSPANVPSPLKEAGWDATLQKKLFADSVITSSQAEAMAQLCSEKFPDSQDVAQDNSNSSSSKENTSASGMSMQISSSAPPSTQDILNVCSGDFQEGPSTQDLLNICSGTFTGVSQICSTDTPQNSVTHHLNAVEEVKTLGEDQDMIISQLLNEDEMEAFKRKFDSPVLTHSQRLREEPEEVAASGGIIDSDGDDEEGLIEVKKKKKNQKKLTFSDDSSEDEEEQEEEIDLHDEIDDDDVPAEINYDSEENEVEYTHEKEKERVKLTDFFEDEAELSESEWGSADEDEKDLDTLEFEQGDDEKFDEKQMRTDLERIHMRRMLDDDTREVKLLQEMLLDDGELHGTGRERQFKWKNIDSLEIGDEEKKNSDDEVGFDEDESEEQWRRKRHEREMFLKEKQSQELNEDEDLLSSSEIFKIGHKVVQRSLSNPQGNSSVEKPKVDSGSPSVKSSSTFMHKRGSFLSRGDQVLQRLAEYNKTTTTTAVAAGKAKNSKNFLFQTVEVQEATAKLSIFNNKRKSTDGTPRVIKKLRLTDNLSPAVNRKKKPDKPKAKAQLFGVS